MGTQVVLAGAWCPQQEESFFISDRSGNLATCLVDEDNGNRRSRSPEGAVHDLTPDDLGREGKRPRQNE
jgi:hypothetical protein